jgi:serine/threonine protein kinase
MSPEVAQYKPYNQGADVFSFGVLLYELMSLDRLSTLDSNPRIVDTSAVRACSCWPDSLRTILVKSLSSIVSERPAMAELLTILTETVSKLETIIRHRKGNNKNKRFNSEGLSIHHFMDNTISF